MGYFAGSSCVLPLQSIWFWEGGHWATIYCWFWVLYVVWNNCWVPG
ncbi:unnamed protein product, partial [Vitis vinifera]|uniref:Uncharacterized protein n=1 Tax=Vitis vinifera TaxID=29760 RepID=D7TRR5_VITVI